LCNLEEVIFPASFCQGMMDKSRAMPVCYVPMAVDFYILVGVITDGLYLHGFVVCLNEPSMTKVHGGVVPVRVGYYANHPADEMTAMHEENIPWLQLFL